MSGTDSGMMSRLSSFQKLYTILKGRKEKYPYPGVMLGMNPPCIMKGPGNIGEGEELVCCYICELLYVELSCT